MICLRGSSNFPVVLNGRLQSFRVRGERNKRGRGFLPLRPVVMLPMIIEFLAPKRYSGRVLRKPVSTVEGE